MYTNIPPRDNVKSALQGEVRFFIYSYFFIPSQIISTVMSAGLTPDILAA